MTHDEWSVHGNFTLSRYISYQLDYVVTYTWFRCDYYITRYYNAELNRSEFSCFTGACNVLYRTSTIDRSLPYNAAFANDRFQYIQHALLYISLLDLPTRGVPFCIKYTNAWISIRFHFILRYSCRSLFNNRRLRIFCLSKQTRY